MSEETLTDPLHPSSGRFEGREHAYPLRVFYEDTDAAGIVYYANYLKFAERARTEAMRLLDLDHRRFADTEGLVFVVRRVEVEYLTPARLDDALIVRTRFVAMGAASVDAVQRIMRDDEVLAQVTMQVVCMSKAGQAARIPRLWREAFKTYLIDHGREETQRIGGAAAP